MAESKDTRAEIIIVAGFVALLAFVWLRNRNQGQGNGFSVDLSLPGVSNGSTNSGVPLSLTMPTLTTTSPTTYAPGAGINVGGTTYTLSNPSTCGCGGDSGNTYGSAADLAASLVAQGYDMPAVTQSEVY